MDSFGKKEVRSKKEKKRKEKEAKRLAKRDKEKSGSLDDMIAWVDADGNITDTPPDPNEKFEAEVEDIQISIPKDEKVEEDARMSGTVSFFNHEKGFGFIKIDNSRDSIFVHIGSVENEDIAEGYKMSFESEPGDKGPVAVRVKRVK